MCNTGNEAGDIPLCLVEHTLWVWALPGGSGIIHQAPLSSQECGHLDDFFQDLSSLILETIFWVATCDLWPIYKYLFLHHSGVYDDEVHLVAPDAWITLHSPLNFVLLNWTRARLLFIRSALHFQSSVQSFFASALMCSSSGTPYS